MNEQELAAELQAAKDDHSGWDVVAAPAKARKRRLGAMVSVRLTAEELAALQGHAKVVGSNVSAYVRDLVVRDLDPTPADRPSFFYGSPAATAFKPPNPTVVKFEPRNWTPGPVNVHVPAARAAMA